MKRSRGVASLKEMTSRMVVSFIFVSAYIRFRDFKLARSLSFCYGNL